MAQGGVGRVGQGVGRGTFAINLSSLGVFGFGGGGVGREMFV